MGMCVCVWGGEELLENSLVGIGHGGVKGLEGIGHSGACWRRPWKVSAMVGLAGEGPGRYRPWWGLLEKALVGIVDIVDTCQ